MKGKWLLISILAVAVGIGAGALSLRRRAPAQTPPPQAGALVIGTNEITLSGPVQPQHVVDVGPEIEGNIDAFLADVGDEVFEGQVLARIGSAGLESTREAAQSDADRAQDQVTRAEAVVNTARLEASRADAVALRSRLEMERTRKTFERQTTLHNAGATPRNVFEKAQSEYQAAAADFQTQDKGSRAAHDTLQSALDQLAAAKKVVTEKASQLEDAQNAFQDAEVRAPAAGTIIGRKGEVGKPASEADGRMFQIATDLYALSVTVQPKPEDLARIHPGQEAMVLLLDLQTAGLQGAVTTVKDGNVTVEFAGAVPGIKPGMRADVRLKF